MANTSTRDHVAIVDRQERVLVLARLGKTLREIGREVGVSHEQARLDLDAALKATLRPVADDVRKLHVERAEWLWLKAAEIVEQDSNPDRRLRALDRCAVALERMAKLEGTDAPSRSQVTVITEDVVDAEIKRLTAQLADRGTAGEDPAAARTSAAAR